MRRKGVALTAVLTGVAPTLADLIIVNSIPGTFLDISSTGAALGLGDEGVAEVTPGFDLNQTLFAGGFGRVWISNNGAIGFVIDGSFGAYYLNAEIPDPALFGAAHGTPQALAVYWDDLDSDTGDVYYETVGDPGARVLIVQWQDRPHYAGDSILDGDEATFQVQIFENGGGIHAQFLYVDVDFLEPALDDGASASIGYQAGGIGNDVSWSYNQAGAVTSGTVLTLLDAPAPCPNLGDGNGDCHIDLMDLEGLAACLDGPLMSTMAGCECYDLTTDGTVDLADYGRFQESFTGSGQSIPDCTPNGAP